ncbi:MAG: class II aldolase/adducin family protein [Clostridiales bacterium]|nr:class II aldolase/adducin family protein [Clostridiales bacterium]
MRWKWEDEYRSRMEDIIEYSKLIYDRNLVSAAGGNVSCRCGKYILITASNVSLRSVTPDALLLCDKEGNVVDGNPNLRPSKETGFHLGVYELRPETEFVIHAHPCFAATWSLQDRELPLYTESARLKLRRVPLIADATPGSRELAENVKRALSGASPDITAFLMEAHGILTLGKTMEECFNQAELLEDTAKIAVLKSMMQ